MSKQKLGTGFSIVSTAVGLALVAGCQTAKISDSENTPSTFANSGALEASRAPAGGDELFKIVQRELAIATLEGQGKKATEESIASIERQLNAPSKQLWSRAYRGAKNDDEAVARFFELVKEDTGAVRSVIGQTTAVSIDEARVAAQRAKIAAYADRGSVVQGQSELERASARGTPASSRSNPYARLAPNRAGQQTGTPGQLKSEWEKRFEAALVDRAPAEQNQIKRTLVRLQGAAEDLESKAGMPVITADCGRLTDPAAIEKLTQIAEGTDAALSGVAKAERAQVRDALEESVSKVHNMNREEAREWIAGVQADACGINPRL